MSGVTPDCCLVCQRPRDEHHAFEPHPPEGWADPISRHVEFADFPVGTRVRVVCRTQDFMFFAKGGMQGPTGTVIRNGGRYLSIIVKFDKPRPYHKNVWCEVSPCSNPAHADYQTEFNFEPDDLIYEDEGEGAIRERPRFGLFSSPR